MPCPGWNSAAVLLSFVLLSIGYPVKAAFNVAPLLSPEFGTDSPVEGPSPCTRSAPCVAMGESVSLMVWTHGKGPSTDPAVYAGRLAPDGTLLDPYGILISKSAGEQTVCAVAANPGGFLVVWSAPHGTTDWDILGARVKTDGTLLDPVPLSICVLSPSVQTSPTVAGNGQNYLVAWRDSRSTGIYGTLVNLDGSIVSTNGFPICTAFNDQFTPAVAALGTNYLAVWQDYRKATSTKYISAIYGARISGSGVLRDTNGIAISTPSTSVYHPAIAAGVTNYLVVWEGYDVGGNDIYGARLTADGSVLDPDAFPISHGGSLQANPVLTSTSEGFLVAWQDSRGSVTNSFTGTVYGTVVSENGAVADAVPISSGPHGQVNPAVSGRGHEALVLWQDFQNNPATMLSDIYGAHLDFTSNTTVGAAFAANHTVNAQWHPAAAPCGTNLLMVWADNRGSSARVYGARFSGNGALLDPLPMPICSTSNRQSDPAVAGNGTQSLVVWSHWPESSSSFQFADIYGALLDETGRLVLPSPIPISTNADDQTLPALSPLGAGFLVVWQDARNRGTSGTHQDIYGARVSSDGTVLDPGVGIAICRDTANHLTPAVAANGSQALVVWTHSRGALTDIYGARLDDSGRVLDTNAFPICRAAGVQSTPTIAANGNGYVVAWVDHRSGAARAEIYAAIVGFDGQVQPSDGFALGAETANPLAPVAAAQGSDYVIVWQRPGAARIEFCDLVGAWISGESVGVSSRPMILAQNGVDHGHPAVAGSAVGPVLVVSQALKDSAARVTGTWFDLQALPRLRLAPASQDGSVAVTVRGSAGRRYTLERSFDLQKWVPADTLSVTGNSVIWTDSSATNQPQGYYRATLKP